MLCFSLYKTIQHVYFAVQFFTHRNVIISYMPNVNYIDVNQKLHQTADTIVFNYKNYKWKANLVNNDAQIAKPASFMALEDLWGLVPESLTQQRVAGSWLVHQQSRGACSADVCSLQINRPHSVSAFHLSCSLIAQ